MIKVVQKDEMLAACWKSAEETICPKFQIIQLPVLLLAIW